MCSISMLNEQERKQLMKDQLDLDGFRHIASQLFPYIESLHLGIGGEPTIHPHFTPFLRIAHEAGVRIELTTNGTMLNHDNIAEACARYVSSIQISIDGVCKKTVERIRNGVKWEQLLDGIKNVVKWKNAITNSSLLIGFNITLMRENIRQLPDLVVLAHDLGVNRVLGEHLLPPNDDLKPESLFLHQELSDQYMLEASERANTLGVALEMPDLFHPNNGQSADASFRNIRPAQRESIAPYCHVLNHSVVIGPSGNVSVCANPDAMHDLLLGNIHQTAFSDMWFGCLLKHLRDNEEHAPAICMNCSMSGRSDGET
ncbi:radical SAM protein, partial [bacterium]|nr:radical SAM protein [bacterium]